MRLAYFALDLPHKGQASYVHIHEIVDNLRALGWQVDLFAPQPASNGSGHSAFTRGAQYLRVIGRLISQLRNYDCIYVRAHPLAWPVTSVAYRYGLPIAQEINGTDIDVVVSHPWLKTVRPFVRWLYKSQYRKSAHLLPVTDALARWLRGTAGDARIVTISNAANTDLFFPLDRVAADPFVVFFGGLTAWHGVDVMIEALRHPRWPRSVSLLIIGVGAQQTIVEAAVASGLPVKWLGSRAYEEIPGLIAGALAGLVPITNPIGRSTTGVLPLKLYETLACGIPVIVSDLPGQADLVRAANCGIVVPCGDAGALAGAVAQIVADPAAAREMGKRGTTLVQAEHSWAARATQIDDVLRKHLAQCATKFVN